MTKTELINRLAEKLDISRKQAAAALDTLAELAVAAVQAHGVFSIPGLGKLKRRERQARMGRNPATGEAIHIPAKTVVKFSLSKAVKDELASKKR